VKEASKLNYQFEVQLVKDPSLPLPSIWFPTNAKYFVVVVIEI